MTRTTQALLLLWAFALGATLSSAQEGGKAERLAKEGGLDRVGAQVLKSTVATLGAQGAAQDPKFAKVVKSLQVLAKPNELTARLVKIYAKHLDAQALDALLAFYATPGGKAFAAKQGVIFAESKLASEEWLQAAFRASLKQAGVASPEENLEQARRHGNEAAAIGALRAISSAQSLFREGDKDGNGELEYAPNLEALGKAGLIDKLLASGTKQGYRFELIHGSKKGHMHLFTWMVIASPIKPGETGGRYFATNHTGVTYYRTDKPIALDREKCEIKDATPVGR